MLIRNCSSIAMVLGMLTLIGGAAGGPGQTDPAAPPSPEIVAKLVAQLGAADFRTRQQASDQLEKLGAPVLPALRKAVRANLELEVKRRIEIVATRIENALLKTEENRWQALDALRRGIKDRVVKILTRTPALNDHQVVSAIYLLSVGRSPADDEVNRVQKQFAENQNRARNSQPRWLPRTLAWSRYNRICSPKWAWREGSPA